MPIAEVGAANTAESTYGTGFTVTSPGTLVPADVVLIVMRTETMTDPAFACSGFTELYQGADNNNNTVNLTVLHGTGFTGSGGFSVTSPVLGSGAWTVRTVTAWSGTDATPITGTAFATGPGGSNFNIPAVTTTVADALVVACLAQAFTTSGRTYSPAFTAEINGNSIEQASRAFASAGSTGTVAVTNSSFSTAVALLVALQEPSAAAKAPPPFSRRTPIAHLLRR